MDASTQIDEKIAGLNDWRGGILTKLRLIISGQQDMVEEWKWNSASWSYHGELVCSIGIFKAHVTLNVFKGTHLSKDIQQHFNSGLDAKESRRIDFIEGDYIDPAVIASIVQAATA